MAKTHYADYSADSVWRCPCGYEGKYQSVRAHRTHIRQHPQCSGSMVQVSPQPISGPVPQPPPVEPMYEPDPTTQHDTPEAPPIQRTGLPPDDDPEALARMLRRQLRDAQPVEPSDDGLSIYDLPPPGEGEYTVRGPDGETFISQAREVVVLPVAVRVIYDWARGLGWYEGDGSLSSFVTAMLLDHFRGCLGKIIVVANVSEVEIG